LGEGNSSLIKGYKMKKLLLIAIILLAMSCVKSREVVQVDYVQYESNMFWVIYHDLHSKELLERYEARLCHTNGEVFRIRDEL